MIERLGGHPLQVRTEISHSGQRGLSKNQLGKCFWYMSGRSYLQPVDLQVGSAQSSGVQREFGAANGLCGWPVWEGTLLYRVACN